MKIVRAGSQAPQGGVSMHAALWNTIKMLVAAIFCGLAVSFVAAGIAIVLASEAEARLLKRETTSTAPPRLDDIEADDSKEALAATPGTLLIGDGCDSLPLQAVERDWQVRIDGNRIDVRVMQAFQLPAGSVEVATFHVQLPKGAGLRSLAAQTSGKDWSGHLISDDQYDRLAPADYLTLTRNRLLVSLASGGTIMTSPIMDLQAGEVVTIQYSYEIASDGEGGRSSFELPLAPASHSTGWIPAAAEGIHPSKSQSTKGAIWVEWGNKNPSQVWGLPVDAALEISKSRIEAFSWSTQEIEPGAQLQLVWSL